MAHDETIIPTTMMMSELISDHKNATWMSGYFAGFATGMSGLGLVLSCLVALGYVG